MRRPKDPAKVRAYNQAYRASHRVEREEYQKAYRSANRVEMLARYRERKAAEIAARGPRQRRCAVCSQLFAYIVGRGADRRHCGDVCQIEGARRRHAELKSSGQWPICVVDGCGKLADGVKSKWCLACRTQLRRTGAFWRTPHKERVKTSHGYYTVVAAGHPLANKHGRIYEHRKVLYDAIGGGEHACYWCGSAVNWIKGNCVKGSLVPDHLNGDKLNNNLTNLVPACNRCNGTRGLFMAWVREHKDDPWLWQMYDSANPVRGVRHA